MNCKIRSALLFGALLCLGWAKGQQSRTLFLQHELPQSSLQNPAVPLRCGWTIGLPVLAMGNFNYGNNFVSFNQLVRKNDDGSYTSNIYGLDDKLRRRDFASTDLVVQLLELGYRRGDWSFLLSVTEKNSLLLGVPGDAIDLVLYGNTQFEGQTVRLDALSVYLNQYTDIGLSVARQTESGVHWGVRGKLLFGKVNVSTSRFDMGLYTRSGTFDLSVTGDVLMRTSLPLYADVVKGQDPSVVRDESASAKSLLLETGNPGLGMDAGIIVPLSDRAKLSLSLVDLGFISWRTNANSYVAKGNYLYTGPFNDTIDSQDYAAELRDALFDSLQVERRSGSYTTLLPAHLRAGIGYEMAPGLTLGAASQLQFYRSKWLWSLTGSADYQWTKQLRPMVSWSYQYQSLANVGVGLVLDLRPFQFYAITDNLLGFANVGNARCLNMIAGMNIIPGCSKKSIAKIEAKKKGHPALDGVCGWENKPQYRRKK